ncbi:MAG: Smr/MutS family protein [Proteobacteria bacterium]|nr:Smr/MutS family protein [Pseudomonadota bacterium]
MTGKKDSETTAEDDVSLFRRLMGDAKPLRQTDKEPERQPQVSARARFARRDERAVLAESLDADIDETETGAGESLRFHRASVGRRTMRKLARGNFSVQDEIDLHGMTAPQAKDALQEFIGECAARGYTCIRIVHGKGMGSGDRGPVIKGKVNKWLRQWNEVLAFVSARQIDGGTGAVYVLLRKNRH